MLNHYSKGIKSLWHGNNKNQYSQSIINVSAWPEWMEVEVRVIICALTYIPHMYSHTQTNTVYFWELLFFILVLNTMDPVRTSD